MQGAALVVDDEKGQREILKTILESEGYDAGVAASGAEAIEAVQKNNFDLVITDLKMPGMDGHELLKNVLAEKPAVSVVIVTAHGSIDSAVEAIREGAFDYLTKPLDRDRLLQVAKKAVEKSRLLSENIQLREQLERQFRLPGIIGSDSRMREVFRIIRKVSGSSATVMIYGESGTGKELIAKALHYTSPRSALPFMAVNCAAIPEGLLETELFGYEKGAFTGAYARSTGLFEAAAGGTIFLDEIGDMSLNLQAKLLRVIQEREIRRVGGNTSVKVDVRIVSATNKDLPSEIKAGRFRDDLYYRLNVISFNLPALRDRRSDIPELAAWFIKKHNNASGKSVTRLTEEAMSALMNHNWPGNVRQLESVIERAVLLNDSHVIGIEAFPMEMTTLPITLGKIDFELPDEGISFEEFERQLILKAMVKSGGVLARAAQLLGMSYRTLQYRLSKFGIDKESFSGHRQSAPKAVLPSGTKDHPTGAER
ncbi:MAG: sigma-54-dependent Fis family transcriptional regulator [Deltaproteobacteria bacterium]|nr:sigma-54-dependent Fis family transcriptional regulator [Deltaproteobacteria bacterium]